MNKAIRSVLRVVLLSAAAGSAFYYYYFLQRPTMGAGPAGATVDRSPFERVWSEGPVVLLGLGDSVTAGFGASDGKSYFARLVENPVDEFSELQGVSLKSVYPNLRTMNMAVSGSNSIHCFETQLPALDPFEADVYGIIVVTTGGNDLIHWYGRTPPEEGAMYGASYEEAFPWIANYEARMLAILNAIVDKFPGGCDIFLANIYDPSDETGKTSVVGLPPWPDLLRIHDAYNAVIERCVASIDNVHFVDIRTPFLGHGPYCRQPWRAHYHRDDPHYWYSENIEDPNDRGYDAIRRAFLDQMADVLAPQA